MNDLYFQTWVEGDGWYSRGRGGCASAITYTQKLIRVLHLYERQAETRRQALVGVYVTWPGKAGPCMLSRRSGTPMHSLIDFEASSDMQVRSSVRIHRNARVRQSKAPCSSLAGMAHTSTRSPSGPLGMLAGWSKSCWFRMANEGVKRDILHAGL